MGAKKGLIFGAAPCADWNFLEPWRAWPDLVIGADGGLHSARKAGFMPGAYVGDGDSGGQVEPELYCVPLKPEKDMTDLQAAYDYARAQGTVEILLTGCTGGRLDHHLSAMGLLERAAREGIQATLLDPENRVEFLLPGIHIQENHGYRYFSLIPVSDVVYGVTISGAKYPLEGRDVCRGDSLTVSNEFLGDTAAISFTGGCCYFIESR